MVVKGLSWFRQMELGFTPTFQLASCASVAAMGSCQSDLLQQSACCKRVVNPQNSAQLCPSLRVAAPSYDWVPLVWKAEPIFSHRKILSWAVFALGLPHWLAGTHAELHAVWGSGKPFLLPFSFHGCPICRGLPPHSCSFLLHLAGPQQISCAVTPPSVEQPVTMTNLSGFLTYKVGAHFWYQCVKVEN